MKYLDAMRNLKEAFEELCADLESRNVPCADTVVDAAYVVAMSELMECYEKTKTPKSGEG